MTTDVQPTRLPKCRAMLTKLNIAFIIPITRVTYVNAIKVGETDEWITYTRMAGDRYLKLFFPEPRNMTVRCPRVPNTKFYETVFEAIALINNCDTTKQILTKCFEAAGQVDAQETLVTSTQFVRALVCKHHITKGTPNLAFQNLIVLYFIRLSLHGFRQTAYFKDAYAMAEKSIYDIAHSGSLQPILYSVANMGKEGRLVADCIHNVLFSHHIQRPEGTYGDLDYSRRTTCYTATNIQQLTTPNTWPDPAQVIEEYNRVRGSFKAMRELPAVSSIIDLPLSSQRRRRKTTHTKRPK